MNDEPGRLAIPPLPAATVVIVVVWNAVILSVIVATSGVPGLDLLALVVALPLNVGFIVWGRHRLAVPFATNAEPTGAVVTPPMTNAPPVGVAHWTGAGAFPTAIGRVTATVPLAHLEVSSGSLSAWIQPALLGLMLGSQRISYHQAEVQSVLPISRSRSGPTRGVAVLPVGRPATYFWTGQVASVLAAAAAAGFPVDWRVHRVPRR